MKPDKLDIKIQEAAAQNEPAYNEQAWSSMEKLLDKEMPQKKKEKRRILWLFLLLFIVAGSLLLLNPSGKRITEKVILAKTNSTSKTTNTLDSTSVGASNTTIKDANQNTIQLSQSPIYEITEQQSFSKEPIQNSKTRIIKNDKTNGNNKETVYRQNSTVENKTGIDNQIINPDKVGEKDQSGNSQ